MCKIRRLESESEQRRWRAGYLRVNEIFLSGSMQLQLAKPAEQAVGFKEAMGTYRSGGIGSSLNGIIYYSA
jgi:hypothetical protein